MVHLRGEWRLVGEHGEGAGERDARGLQGRQGSDHMRSL